MIEREGTVKIEIRNKKSNVSLNFIGIPFVDSENVTENNSFCYSIWFNFIENQTRCQ